MIEKLIESILDWPFLGFVLICICIFKFGEQIKERILAVVEMSIGGKTKIVLGTKEIDASEIGPELTKSFQDLVQRVENLEGASKTPAEDQQSLEISEDEDMPEGLKSFLWPSVFRMLNSDYWYARYVDTLAKNTATSPELMERFLRSRPDVEVFDDGGRLAASLKSRSRTRS